MKTSLLWSFLQKNVSGFQPLHGDLKKMETAFVILKLRFPRSKSNQRTWQLSSETIQKQHLIVICEIKRNMTEHTHSLPAIQWKQSWYSPCFIQINSSPQRNMYIILLLFYFYNFKGTNIDDCRNCNFPGSSAATWVSFPFQVFQNFNEIFPL